MRSNKKQPRKFPVAPVYRAIPTDAVQNTAQHHAAPTYNDLDRYADSVQQFLRSSRMRTLLNRVQVDLAAAAAESVSVPHMRLRRD